MPVVKEPVSRSLHIEAYAIPWARVGMGKVQHVRPLEMLSNIFCIANLHSLLRSDQLYR